MDRVSAIDASAFVCMLKPEGSVLTAAEVAGCQRAFMAQLAEAGEGAVALDLSDITSIDSTGVSLVVGTHKECQKGGHELTTYVREAFVIRVFEVMRLDQHLHLVQVE